MDLFSYNIDHPITYLFSRHITEENWTKRGATKKILSKNTFLYLFFLNTFCPNEHDPGGPYLCICQAGRCRRRFPRCHRSLRGARSSSPPDDSPAAASPTGHHSLLGVKRSKVIQSGKAVKMRLSLIGCLTRMLGLIEYSGWLCFQCLSWQWPS